MFLRHKSKQILALVKQRDINYCLFFTRKTLFSASVSSFIVRLNLESFPSNQGDCLNIQLKPKFYTSPH